MSYTWFLGSGAHSLTSCQERLHPSVHNKMNANLDLPGENSKQTRKAKITDTISIITGKLKCVHSTRKHLTKTEVVCPNVGRAMRRKPSRSWVQSREDTSCHSPQRRGSSKMLKAQSVGTPQPFPSFLCSQTVTLFPSRKVNLVGQNPPCGPIPLAGQSAQEWEETVSPTGRGHSWKRHQEQPCSF